MRKRWLSAQFSVPAQLQHARFTLRPLLVGDVVKDYDAVMTSQEHLQSLFGPDQNWPIGLTLEQDLIDLGWHQKEFQLGTSFTYSMVNPQDTMVLGCVYIFPPTKRAYDAEVLYWVRASELRSGLDNELGQALRQWFAAAWPFKNVGYPGRDIAWSDWQALP